MVGLIVAVGAIIVGSVAVRVAVVPGWLGARARLAEAITFLATVFALGQALGAVGLLRGPAVVVACVIAGVAMVAGARRWGPATRPGRMSSELGVRAEDDTDDQGSAGAAGRATEDRRRAGRPGGCDDPTEIREDTEHGEGTGRNPRARDRFGPGRGFAAGGDRPRAVEWGLAVIAVGVVGVQWISHTLDAMSRGMPHPDTHWYHGPFVVRFLQAGGFPALDGVGYPEARWFPFDAHLGHVLTALPHHRDWLSPLHNLGWMALALLAAWVIGERRGAGPTALATAAVVLGLPLMAATQPGQASTDIAVAALLLATIALLLESDLRVGPTALAGAALGLTISTKVTIAVPVAALAVAVLVLLLVRRRWTVAAWWTGSVAATGTFWFARNWVLIGSPLPWFSVPPFFDEVLDVGQEPSLLSSGELTTDLWGPLYRPGLEQALGPAWLVGLAVLVVGAALLVVGRGAVERIAGLVVVAGVVGYAVTPLTAGISFAFNLRYVGPALLLAAVLVPLVLPSGSASRIVTSAVAVVLVGVGATAEHVELTPAWPSSTPAAVAVAVVGVAVTAAAVGLVRRRLIDRRVVIAALALVVLIGGYPVLRDQEDRRYVSPGLPTSDTVSAAMRSISDADIGVFGTDETYPMFGLDLSNRVELGTAPPGDDRSCAAWRRHLSGAYDYVAISVFALGPRPRPRHEDLAGDPAVTVVVRDGGNAVYRIDGPLDPDSCP